MPTFCIFILEIFKWLVPIPIIEPDWPPYGVVPFKLLLTAYSFLLDPPLERNPLKNDFFEIPLNTPPETPDDDLFSSALPVDALPAPLKLEEGRILLFAVLAPVYIEFIFYEYF